MDELKPCPFCGGVGRVSFKDYKFYGRNGFGDKKIKYRTQVICNRCRSRGKPIITDWLINPNPYISKWGNCGDGTSPNGSKQTSMFAPYVVKAIEAWNHRERDGNGEEKE